LPLVEFTELVDKLTFTRNDPTATREEQEGAATGFGQILDKLAEVVAELAQTA